MNLKQTPEGVVELNGEPIADWYKKRGITPCIMRYVEIDGDSCKMCLIAAMGFSAVENRMTVDEYQKSMGNHSGSHHGFVAYLLGIEAKIDVHNVELGFLSHEVDMVDNKCPLQQLGYAARTALIAANGTIDAR